MLTDRNRPPDASRPMPRKPTYTVSAADVIEGACSPVLCALVPYGRGVYEAVPIVCDYAEVLPADAADPGPIPEAELLEEVLPGPCPCDGHLYTLASDRSRWVRVVAAGPGDTLLVADARTGAGIGFVPMGSLFDRTPAPRR